MEADWREESERSNRAKDEFFSHLAHELRTPLNAVHGWTHLLSTGGLSPAEKRDAIDVIWLTRTRRGTSSWRSASAKAAIPSFVSV